jgi:hypothetical protein
MKNLSKLFNGLPDKQEGLDWYQEAHQFACWLADKHTLSVSVVAGVISALSPSCNWEQNKKGACRLIELATKGKHSTDGFMTYRRNVLKAYEIIRTGEPEKFFSEKTGAKTYNFFYNIWQPTSPNHVTIDRHSFEVATGEKYNWLTKYQYTLVADHYKKASAKLGILPNQLQAILWVDFRKQNEIYFKTFTPF